jgi:hypothetical protein
MGKGSTRRPQSVPREKFDRAWDAIFKKQKEGKERNNERLVNTDSADSVHVRDTNSGSSKHLPK